MRHMDEGLLQSWLDGPRAGLTDEEREAVEAHLAECAACVEKVEALRAGNERARGLLAIAEEVEDGEMPAFDAVVRRARELNGEPGASSATTVRPWWGRRTAWAASIMVALGAGWLANEWNTGSSEGRVVPSEVVGEPSRGTDAAVSLEAPLEDVGSSPDGEELPYGAPAPSDADASDAAPAAADASGTPPRQQTGLVPPPAEPDPVARVSTATAPRQTTVRGRVVDESTGRALESVQVGIPGTPVATLTDADGHFLLRTDAERDSTSELVLALDIAGYRREELAMSPSARDIEVGEVELRRTTVTSDEFVASRAAGVVDAPEAEFAAPRVPEALEDGRWGPASRAEASDHLGGGVVTVPGLPVTAVHVGTFDGVAVARVEQELPDGSLLTLVQSETRVLMIRDDAGSSATIRTRDGWLVTGWAGLPADSLRTLLNRLAAN